MNRRQKNPNTKTFRFFNANPKGRLTGDCVIRAISIATKKDYNEVVMGLAETMCETGYDMQCPEGFDRYLAKLGWTKQKQPRKDNGKKYTGEEFCNLLNKYGWWNCDGIIANIGGNHTVAIMPTDKNDPKENWKVFDTWNSTQGSIGNYWIKKEC